MISKCTVYFVEYRCVLDHQRSSIKLQRVWLNAEPAFTSSTSRIPQSGYTDSFLARRWADTEAHRRAVVQKRNNPASIVNSLAKLLQSSSLAGFRKKLQ